MTTRLATLARLSHRLEYAEHNASAEHQAVTDQVCSELGIAPIQFARDHQLGHSVRNLRAMWLRP